MLRRLRCAVMGHCCRLTNHGDTYACERCGERMYVVGGIGYPTRAISKQHARCARCGARLYAGGWGSRLGRVCISCSYVLRDEDSRRGCR